MASLQAKINWKMPKRGENKKKKKKNRFDEFLPDPG